MKIKIKENQTEERLDKFLGEYLEDISRSQVQKLIKQGSVIVNNKKVASHYKLKEDDEVSIFDTENKPTKEEKKIEKSKRQFSLEDVEIIEDNDEFLVINKPAGLTVHPGEGIRSLTLVDLFLEKYPKLKKIGEDPARPGIVHRIDKEVSGLMVIAKTQDSFDNLKEQFQKRTVHKEYTALVYGAVSKESDEINFPIKRSSGSFKMAAMPVTDKGELNSEQDGVRRAITEFRIEQEFINFTLLKVKIKTGRTHQIRVHMLAYGHPIVGDSLYSTVKTREKNKKMKLGRVFLAATSLGFKDLEGKEKKYEIELPEELQEVLRKVK